MIYFDIDTCLDNVNTILTIFISKITDNASSKIFIFEQQLIKKCSGI